MDQFYAPICTFCVTSVRGKPPTLVPNMNRRDARCRLASILERRLQRIDEIVTMREKEDDDDARCISSRGDDSARVLREKRDTESRTGPGHRQRREPRGIGNADARAIDTRDRPRVTERREYPDDEGTRTLSRLCNTRLLIPRVQRRRKEQHRAPRCSVPAARPPHTHTHAQTPPRRETRTRHVATCFALNVKLP